MGRHRQSVTATALPASEAFGHSRLPQHEQAEFQAATAQSLDFYNTTPVSCMTLDDRGRVCYANLAMCTLLGASQLTLVGQPLTRFILAQDQDAFYLFRKRVITTGFSQSMELRLLRDGCPPLWVQMFATDARDAQDAPVQQIAVVDISERKILQQLLEDSEFRFRSLINNLQVGVMLQGPKAEVLLSNRMALDLLGLTEEQLAGKTLFDPDWNVIHESGEPFPGPTHPVPQAILTRRSVRNVIMGVYNPKTQGRNWLSVDADPHFNPDGSLQQVVCTFNDISARKHIEAELKQASLAADAANSAKSRFLAAASHDLRQPLSALSLYVGVMRNKATPELQELVGNFQDCVGNMSELLTDLLDISKLEAGAIDCRPTVFSVSEFFAALRSVVSGNTQGAHLRIRIRPSNYVAFTDVTLLRRIVGNFVDNAIRFTNKGGILLACRRHAGKQWIEVWDTGIGIPEDKIVTIFEDFSQLGDGARTRGSGLGLAISRQMAALLGLQIRVRSRPGRGSVFAVELPQGHLQTAARPPALVNPTNRKLRVAILDDNRYVLQALKMMLEAAGHSVVDATSLSELLAHLPLSRPDILVTDYRLNGGHTGFDAIAEARSLWGTNFPAIIITGDTNPSLIQSMATQAVPVLYKPVCTDTLQRAISAAIEKNSL